MTRVIKSDDSFYEVLENALRGITTPKTCVMLMDDPDVRRAAIEKFGPDVRVTTNKVSDRLNFMWRKQVLDRFDAPYDSRSKAFWAYALKGECADYSTPIKFKKPEKDDVPVATEALKIIEKDGEVIIKLKQFTITVKPNT